MVKTSCIRDESCVKGKISKFVHIIATNNDFIKISRWSKYTKMTYRIVHCNKKISTH